jgi:hypothetical protein
VRKVRVSARKWARKLLGLGDPPHSIALGAALGMAIAFGPTYGMQIILALGLATLLRINRVATLLPTFIVNPVTGPVVFVLQYLLGRGILGGGSDAEREKIHCLAQALGDIRLRAFGASVKAAAAAGADLGWGVLGAVLLGMVVSAGVLALLTYPLVYRGVLWFRRKRAAHSQRRRAPAPPATAPTPPEPAGPPPAPGAPPGPGEGQAP